MTSHSTIALNALLASLLTLCCVNFFIPFVSEVHEISVTINSWFIVISGLLINSGTVIQIIVNITLKNNTLQLNYISCLVFGCSLLSVGQLFAYVHKMLRDTDFLISLISSFASFVFTTTLLAINKYNTTRQRRRGDMDLHDISIPKKITYYEGTSGVGKTTTGVDHSYDYTEYIDKQPLFKLKHSLPYVQTMYMMQLYSDIVLDLLEFSRDDSATTAANDRHILSQLVYDILFFYKGERTNPQEFRQTVSAAIFNDRHYLKLIRSSMRRVFTAVTSIAPNVTMNIDWFVSSDPLFTKQKLIDRGGFEVHQADWNLEWYVQNQNYVFRRLWEISGIGDLHVVKLVQSGK